MADSRTGPPPDDAALEQAALTHLARYGGTRMTLTRVLDRRVERWARAQPEADSADMAAKVAEARRAVRRVVAKLAAGGGVDDAAFAAARARRLARTGRSRRAAAAHLAARGVDRAVVQAALTEDVDAELSAAVAFLRRRRFGPFRAETADADARRRELAALARAGFPQAMARRALALSPDEAELILLALRTN